MAKPDMLIEIDKAGLDRLEALVVRLEAAVRALDIPPDRFPPPPFVPTSQDLLARVREEANKEPR